MTVDTAAGRRRRTTDSRLRGRRFRSLCPVAAPPPEQPTPRRLRRTLVAPVVICAVVPVAVLLSLWRSLTEPF